MIAKIRSSLGEEFDIKELDMSIGAVHLKDVQISLKDNYYLMQIDDIRLGFNFFNLIKSGFSPQRIPQDVILINPQLTIQAVHNVAPRKNVVDTSVTIMDTKEYLKKIEDYVFIKRITISNGKISYIDSANKKMQLAKDINGWLSTKDIGFANARLVCKIFQSKN